jgi:Ribosomal protein L25 (general stress protein Ctc)
MELTTLKATSRVLVANRDNARLRKAGQIPAVYYGKGMEALNITVSDIDLRKVLAPGKRYTLLDLEIDGKAGNPASSTTTRRMPSLRRSSTSTSSRLLRIPWSRFAFRSSCPVFRLV